MVPIIGEGNSIDPSASLEGNIVIGNYNYIGKNVIIGGFKGRNDAKIEIGDCNYIYDNTRILMGSEGMTIGDWNVFHNNMLIVGERRIRVGHNCWFGQNTVLDSSGGLYIANGVRTGMYSQIWTHAAGGELIEGCTLYATSSTYMEDDVWIVGGIVSSGVRLGRRSICLPGSVVTKDTLPGAVYGGVPAVLLERLNFWKNVSFDEKLEMMLSWVKIFAEQSNGNVQCEYLATKKEILIEEKGSDDMLIVGIGRPVKETAVTTTYFDLEHKTYTKRLSELERSFYKYIYNYKAKFIPSYS